MALSAWFTGSARTAVRDAKLLLAEWQSVEDKLKELWDLLGDFAFLSGTLTDHLGDAATSQASAAGLVKYGLRVEPVPAEDTHQIRVTADKLGIGTTVVSNVDVTIDVAASGLLGLDTGSEAIDKTYAVWVGRDPDTGNVTGIMSLEFTVGGLTLSGALAPYTEWRRVHAVRNNHVGDLIPATRQGDSVRYDAHGLSMFNHATIPGLTVLQTGSAGTGTSIDLSPLVPESSRLAHIIAEVSTSGAEGKIFFYAGNTTLDVDATPAPMFVAIGTSETSASGTHAIVTDDAQAIFYRATTAATLDSLSVMGFEDPV